MAGEAITLFREDVLNIGQMVDQTVEEMGRLLRKDRNADLNFLEDQEKRINQLFQEIEEKCLDLLKEKDRLAEKDIRMLVVSTVIASKFERIADHANRVAKIAWWAEEEDMDVPEQLVEMASVIQRMVKDVLFSFLTENADKTRDIMHRDSEVDYLDAVLSKQLLSDIGEQGQAKALMQAQFLFCARFLERMGDLCSSIAKRIYFIVTGERIKPETSGIV